MIFFDFYLHFDDECQRNIFTFSESDSNSLIVCLPRIPISVLNYSSFKTIELATNFFGQVEVLPELINSRGSLPGSANTVLEPMLHPDVYHIMKWRSTQQLIFAVRD